MMLARAATTLGPRGRGTTTQLVGFGLFNPFESNPFDSWWWENRKWLFLGGLGVAGIGALAIVGKVLR